MILVDTSVWADHFRQGEPALERLLGAQRVLCHPFVAGELLMGNPRNRDGIRTSLLALPQALVAEFDEIVRFIESERLFGTGLSFIDAHLIASVRLTEGSALWARDGRLVAAAVRSGVSVVNEPLQ